MKKYNDTDLREALRRREAKRPQTEVPDDFLSNVMQKTEAQQHPRRQDASGNRRPWRIALAALAAAASVALVVMLTWPKKESSALGQSIECGQSVNRVRSVTQSSAVSYSIERGQSVNRVRSVTQSSAVSYSIERGQSVNRVRSVSQSSAVSQSIERGQSEPGGLPVRARRTENEPTDSLDYYIAQMEAELAGVRDSCYLAQVERMVLADEALSQLMNEMTNPKQ